MRFILYSMIVDAIANLPAYGRELEKFRFNRRIDGLYSQAAGCLATSLEVFAVFQQRSSSSKARDGWPEEETTVLQDILRLVEIRLTSPPLIAEIRPDRRSERFHSSGSLRHPAFDRYRESYPRRNVSPRNCSSRGGDERSAVPVSV